MAAKPSTAAEKAIQKIQEQVTCVICMEPKKQQRMLKCAHSFCEKCLQPLQQGHSVKCPTCREKTHLPDSGVTGLQINFHQSTLHDIKDILETSEIKENCTKHSNKGVELYCETCDQLICSHCLVSDHQTHKYDLIPASFDKYKKVILNSLKPVEEQMELLEGALKPVRDESDAIKQQEESVVEEIHTTFKRIRETLDEREAELVDEAKCTVKKKLNTLSDQHDQFEQQLSEMKRCHDSVNDTQTWCSQVKVLEMKSHLLKQVEDLTRKMKPDSLLPAELANVKFYRNVSNLEETSKQFGKICSSLVCPEKCRTYGDRIEVATRGEDTTISVIALDQEGDACIRQVFNWRCELVASDGSSRVRANVKRTQNTYDISYQPLANGEHQLHILIEEQHILNSPFSVSVIPNFTAPARVIKSIDKPRGVAVTEEGKVAVATSGSNRLTIVSGNKERYIQPPYLYLNEPEGVAINAAGDIIVVNCGNSRILKISSNNFKHVNTFGGPGNGPLQFNSPIGIAIHHLSNKVYIADTGNHRIQILNSDLTYSSSFGKKGSGNGEFNHPCDIAIDRDGHVYIADRDNKRIQVFTADGDYIRQFGSGNCWWSLEKPVCISIAGNIAYVAECGKLRIAIFFTNGKPIEEVGKYRSNQTIHGLTTDKRGSVYVSDADENSIQIFK